MRPSLPSEEILRFRSGDLELDGRLFLPPDPVRGCVVCHPHPLYGGDMNSSIVTAVTAALAAANVATLRFDFRGVGASGGVHGGGGPEIGDARAAVAALRAAAGLRRISIAGYSFGAMVALRMAAVRPEDDEHADESGVEAVVAIAPPLAMFDASFVSGLGISLLLVAGEHDEYCPRDRFDALEVDNDPGVVCAWNETKRVRLPGTDHFFAGKEQDVGALVASWVKGLGTFP